MQQHANDLYTMHKEGVIDLMSRDGAENETDRIARAAEPGEYALTYEESRMLTWAYNIYDTVIVTNGFLKKDETTGTTAAVITPESTDKILDAFKERGLNSNEIYELSKRVINGNWYTLLLSPSSLPEDGPLSAFTLVAKINGVTSRQAITKTVYSAVFETGASRAVQRQSMGLPDDVKFLFSTELADLDTFLTVCNPQITLEENIHISSPPKTIVHPKSAVVKKYFDNRLPIGQTGKVIQKMDKKANGYAIVTREKLSLTNLPAGVTITGKEEPTSEHSLIHDVVCSYSDAGKRTFTDAGICSTMGKSNTRDNRDSVNKMIVDMMQDIITIDTGTMGDFYHFEKKTIKGNVLPIKILEETVGNQYGETTFRTYKLLDEPILLTYGKLLNQIVRYPRDVFNTPANKNFLTLNLHCYLIERISSIGVLSNRIVYDTLYDELNLSAGSKASLNNRKATIRARTREILTAWTKAGYIDGWHEETKDRHRVKLDKCGKAKKGLSSYCIVIEGKPKLTQRLEE